MVHYKLSYFPIRALAETARQLFALANVDFEDDRVPREQWPDFKPKTPFGQMPVLEVDGKALAQSRAIYRYLAKKFGFAGKDDWESAQIDAWADQFVDYNNELRPYFVVVAGFGEGDKEKLYADVVEPAREKFLPLVAKQLKENGSGFLVGSKVSWVDLHLAGHIETFLSFVPHFADKYPEVVAHQKKVHAIPELKKWIEKRPQTPF
ncbi:unnamed protein product, partial [Mesorhabditis belari]|uniref:glutathione transferase n=1 Tax=Mesorhabditis belari TaxID=2138241 RepID=A0AAF3EA60_9BILA